MILSKEERALIGALRESGFSPVATLIGTRNYLYHTADRQMQQIAEVMDEYIMPLLDEEPEGESMLYEQRT